MPKQVRHDVGNGVTSDMVCGGPSADASGESKQNMQALCGRKRHSIFCRSDGPKASEAGQKICGLVVLFDLQGKGPERKEAFSADLIFGLLLYQDKSNSPSGN